MRRLGNLVRNACVGVGLVVLCVGCASVSSAQQETLAQLEKTEKACTDLVLDYALYRDEHDVEGYVGLFTDDAVLSIQGQTYTGKNAIRARMQGAAKGPKTRHLMSTIRIRSLGADRATGISYATIYAAPPQSSTVEGFAVIGNYIDEFELTPQGWKIASRRLDEAFRYQAE